ncbi:hypothetical protein [Bacillus wiedmannii]|uniref:hypothetical protein n=1 Tax=Bacillus wiedmannii TaxID=1890302 RepID=UPI003D9884FB
MTNVDEHTQVAFEVVEQTFKLSEQALLRILEALTKLLENKEQDPKDYILDGNTKDGKKKSMGLLKNIVALLVLLL